MRICISVGHGKSAGGGYDSGAVGGGFHEFRIARKIGFYIAEALKNYGCDTVLINYDADMYLTDRIAYVNRENFDLAAEIHLNAGGGTGSEVYYKHADEMALTAFGKTPVSVEYSELYTIISLIFTFIVGAVSYWKNNSFTSAAIEADKFMHEQRIAEGEDDNGTSL